jgi:eukaryotic-like serine/threonine-protein kinase
VTDIAERLSSALADRYRIERELGAGGMATVYLAQDLRHDRKVAIKVLRPELAAVIGAERFLSEIKTTANLQHPHILPLHDSGQADSFLFYVMPFVEGESLRDRLVRERHLPIGDAVRIATEVADALDYAHRHGVIHRDVKPENILLHDGRALVADFGIALAASKAGGTRMTETGMSLGTPTYMSPEQAMGEREITARSDVYALGCMTYEMLVGDPPFTGSTAQAIVAKVLTEKPVPPSRMRDTVPASVEDAVLTALAKLPADRFASAAEFAAALSAGGAAATRAASGARPSRPGRMLWPAVAALAGAVALWGWLRPRPAARSFPPSRLAVLVPELGGSSTALQRQLALTPDGSTLLYTAVENGQNITMRMPLDASEASAIPGVVPFLAGYAVSRDGREFLGSIAGNETYRYPIGGGSGRPLPREIAVTSFTAWARDGSVWMSSERSTDRSWTHVTADGQVTHPFGARHGDLNLMQLLPDDRSALAVASPPGASSGPAVLLDLATGTTTQLMDATIVEIRYAAGYLVYVLPDGTMEAVSFDPSSRKVAESPVTIATGVSLTGSGLAQFAVADNGTIAYIPEEPRSLVLVNRDGSSRPALAERHNYHAPKFSPDGRRILVDFASPDGRDVWVLDRDGGGLTRVTFDRGGHDAVWEPGGRSITYATVRPGVLSLFRTRPGGAEKPESLFSALQLGYTGHWLRDGSALVTVGNGLDSGSLGDIAILRNGGHGPLEPLVATRFDEVYPDVSPDDQWLAFSSNQSGQVQVYVRPLNGHGDQIQVSLDGGTEPMWSRDGRELFYRAGSSGAAVLMAATIQTKPVLAVTSRRSLFSVGDIMTSTPHSDYDVSPDGRTFVMVRQNPAARIMVIQNLPALVERLRGAGGTR